MSKPSRKAPELRFKGFTDDWEQRKLNELMNFSNGINASKDSYGKGRKMISVMDILDPSPLQYSNIRSSVEVPVIIENNKRVENGDLVFVRSSEISEEVGWAKAYLDDEFALYSGFSIRGKKKSNFDSTFLERSLNSYGRKQIERKAGGSTRFNVSQETLNSISAYTPDVLEQTQIGVFFKKLESTILLHQRKLDALKHLKEAYLQSMFPKKGESVPKLRFNFCTDDWNSYKAETIFYSVSDKNHPNLPILSASQEKGMVYRDTIGIDIKYNANSLVSYKRVLPNQFVIHLRSFQGGFAYSEVEGITSPAYTILDFIDNNEQYPLFWKYILSNINFIKQLESVTYGIRDGRSISFTDFSSLKFQVPSYGEQKSIAFYLKQLDISVQNFQIKINKLTLIKKAYSQKMFI